MRISAQIKRSPAARFEKEFDIRCVYPVREYSRGQRVVRFHDPDLHIIEVGENMKAVCKRFSDSGMTKEKCTPHEKSGVHF